MNKQELIEKVSASVKEGDIQSKAAADRIVSAVFDSIFNEVASGGKVSIVGFGTFESVERAAKVGVDPQTHKPKQYPAKKAVKFVAGKPFKDAVNK